MIPILAVMATALSTPAIFAATFTVTNTNDSGPGSLRQAVVDSNANQEQDTILFDAAVFNVPQTVVLNGQLTISGSATGVLRPLTIVGPGAHLLTIDGNNVGRVISIERDARLVISGVKITRGNAIADVGGGIYSAGGYIGDGVETLVLRNSIVTGNVSDRVGGGMYLWGNIRIENSLINNNLSNTQGGGFANGHGATITIANSTIGGNQSLGDGGGIWNQGSTLEITNSTIAFNTGGGGIVLANQLGNTPRLFSRNSIYSNNLRSDQTAADVWGEIVSRGNNIIGRTFFPISGDTASDQTGVDPQLDPTLRLNGGVIPTHALGTGSPAIDRGNNCVLNPISAGGCLEIPITADQRGVTRPRDGDSDGTATVDIGAFEITEQEVAFAPGKPDLIAADDSGVSSSDDITSNRTLNFVVSKTVSGASVEFYRNGTLVETKVASGTTTTFNVSGLPADGQINFQARQIINAENTFFGPNMVVTLDNTAPSVVVNQNIAQQDPIPVQPIYYVATFSEPVFGFGPTDVSIAGTAGVSGAAVTVDGSGPYNLLVANISSDGTVIVSVPSGGATDVAGNGNAASTSTDNTVTLDTVAPTVTVNQAAAQIDPTRVLPVNFAVVFSEPVLGFTASDVSLVGSTANVTSASKTVTGSGSIYNVTVSGFSSQGGTVVVSIPASSVQDPALNFNTASTSTDNSVTVDNVSPTVTVNQAIGQADPTNVMPVNFSVIFSEPVTGFDAADVSLTGSFGFSTALATITVTGSGTAYNVAVGNITTNPGSLRVTIRSAAATDALGNTSFASTSTDNLVSIDNVGPTLSINQAIGQSDPAWSQPVTFVVIFNDQVSGFDAGDVSLAGSTANVLQARIEIAGSGSVYYVSVSNILSSGTVRLNVSTGAATDAIGNPSTTITVNDNSIFLYVPTRFDYDGDGIADLSVIRPSNNSWYLQQSVSGYSSLAWGQTGDRTVPADYDGDGKTDVAVFRPSYGRWFIIRSSDGTFETFSWGVAEDLPVPADRDNDGRDDLIVFRPSTSTWYIRTMAAGPLTPIPFGEAGDKPMIGDFDADGIGDIALFRPSNNNWYIVKSSLGFFVQTWGEAGDIPTTGDFDGDGATDQAVFRPSTGQWYLSGTTAGFSSQFWGQNGDIPVAADYDGDGRTDLAVFRPSNSTWFIVGSSNGIRIQLFGTTGDLPVPRTFSY